jgi:hypothetical protein
MFPSLHHVMINLNRNIVNLGAGNGCPMGGNRTERRGAGGSDCSHLSRRIGLGSVDTFTRVMGGVIG